MPFPCFLNPNSGCRVPLSAVHELDAHKIQSSERGAYWLKRDTPDMFFRFFLPGWGGL
jgi:hypothetical protein